MSIRETREKMRIKTDRQKDRKHFYSDVEVKSYCNFNVRDSRFMRRI